MTSLSFFLRRTIPSGTYCGLNGVRKWGKSMIGSLNKSYLEGEETVFKGVIGRESIVTHTNWEKVIFGTFVWFPQ